MTNLKPTLLCGMMLPAALSAQERPNILYIMTDQQTANAMSCAGNTDLRTPNMDKLAERGIRFTNAYCSMPPLPKERLTEIVAACGLDPSVRGERLGLAEYARLADALAAEKEG